MIEGTQIGAYRVLQRIGEGGMGEVWLAEHAMLGRRAALKVLHAEFSNRPEIVTRFFNEARAATAIADPGIVQIFDFGQHVDGSAYIVMELLDGEPLDKRLARVGALDMAQALRIMRQVASTLGAAHARSIVHRDLKPENIFIVRDPEVAGGERAKVLDFGIAKLAADPGASKTQTSAIMGTPTYMSPEQCRGAGHVDQRSDVYAMGCMLFRLLCGRPPFDAEGVGDIIAMHLREAPPAPSQVRAGLPPQIDHLVLRCMAKDPNQRFNNGTELANALAAMVSSPSLSVPAPTQHYASASKPTTLSSAAGAAGTLPPATTAGKGSGRVIAIGVAAAAVIGGGVFVGMRKSQPDETKAAAQPDHAAEAPTPTPAPAPTPAPNPAPPAAPRPATELAADGMKKTLELFSTWAASHPSDPCPDLSAFAPQAVDAWNHAYHVTCSDQPANQIVGLVSDGPDGVAKTDDDVASWQLSADVTKSVKGARWSPQVAAKTTTTPKTPSSTKPKTKTKTKTTTTSTSHGGGVELDENGLPISR